MLSQNKEDHNLKSLHKLHFNNFISAIHLFCFVKINANPTILSFGLWFM